MRQQAIQQQHRGRNYTKEQASSGLWDLVRASEMLTNREQSETADEEHLADADAGASEQPVSSTRAAQSVHSAELDPPPSPQQVHADQQRRKGVFEDIGVSQQAAWCGPLHTSLCSRAVPPETLHMWESGGRRRFTGVRIQFTEPPDNAALLAPQMLSTSFLLTCGSVLH